ncbi:MAG: Fic family protein [bacterium]|nr:Fic family protein [bacterium]
MTKSNTTSPFDLPVLPPQLDYLVLVPDLARAHAAIARLDETLTHLRNPRLIERTFLTREAVLSSQIEGTQATLEEVLREEAEAGEDVSEATKKLQDIREVLNYRRAMQEGVRMVDKDQPLAENGVKRLHAILLQSVRGKTRAPGEFRRNQVYIAPPGTPMSDARYVPPPPMRVPDLYSNFDRYFNADDAERDPLVQIAVAHYQFEAIHPFSDGNGRVGRLLIPLFLYQRKLLSKPYVYVSKYFEEHRRDYYDLLADVSYKGAWTPWLRFFLNGLTEQAADAATLAHRILDMQREYHSALVSFKSPYALNLLDTLFAYPIMTTTQMRRLGDIPNTQTLLNLVKKFVKVGILKDVSPTRQRNKTYVFQPLLDLLDGYDDAKG